LEPAGNSVQYKIKGRLGKATRLQLPRSVKAVAAALGFKLGVPEALGLARREWADRIGHTLRSIEQRRGAVAELSAEGFSNRAIADALGVSAMTVGRDLSVTNVTPGIADDNEEIEPDVTNVTPPFTQPKAAQAAGEAAGYDYLAEAHERGETPTIKGLTRFWLRCLAEPKFEAFGLRARAVRMESHHHRPAPLAALAAPARAASSAAAAAAPHPQPP
jgi:hypothetical protein